MRRLVIETATSACSVALIEDGVVIASDSAVVGRGHAERLLPMIAALPGGGRADALWVDCGPGSFTGIRVGVAAARALGLGWQIPVDGYSSLALIAADWFSRHDGDGVTVVIAGGHGEVFIQPYARSPLRETAPIRSLPEASLVLTGAVAGNTRHAGDEWSAGPDARHATLLSHAPLPPTPVYGRPPDAKPMA